MNKRVSPVCVTNNTRLFREASTGAIYKMFGGWRSLLVATVLCAGVSTPIGLLAQAGNMFLIPEEYRLKQQEKKEEKRKLCVETS
ncbi:hypothetical protein QZH41_005103 [Actinostola sp. cb2023]|nr:hypothetical protein QZH41_005103 [Actinostola sp. cb2023]